MLEASGPEVAASWGGPRVRRALLVIGAGWVVLLGALALDRGLPARVPAVPRFFLQSSCLFPRAGEMQIEYRVEAYACQARKFQELDHRPYFPLRADDKESRFHRVGHFYRRNRTVMQALERYLIDRHNRRAAGGGAGDGVEGPIGGIRFMSLRIPLPPMGARVERNRVGPLHEYTADQRVTWYITSIAARRAYCEGGAP